ncbi:hypothetical protein Tco_0126030 [Tanacetum coccineum]
MVVLMVVCEAFKKYGLKVSGGWNIRRQRMLHIVYLVIFSIRSPLDELVLIGLPSKGSTKAELQHYELDVRNHPRLKKVSKLSTLCKGLHETGKSKSYPF